MGGSPKSGDIIAFVLIGIILLHGNNICVLFVNPLI